MSKRSALAICATLLFSALALGAGPAASERVVQLSQENASALRSHTWKTRLEMTLEDGSTLTRLFRVDYDEQGALRTAGLDPDPEPAKWWAFRGRIKEKRARELADWAATLTERVTSYTTPSRGQLLDFYAKARTSPADGLTRYRAVGFLAPDDTATFWIDPRTGIPTRFGFSTTFDDAEVLGEVEFDVLEDGTRYARRITVEVPTKQVRAVIETFDYTAD